MGRRDRLIGERFHNGIVVKCCDGNIYRGQLKWEVKCDCGNTYYGTTTELTRGLKKHCGCLRIQSHKLIRNKNIGEKYGKLTIIDIEYKDNKAYRLCRCDCGNEVYVKQGNLTSGGTVSCGCHRNRSGKDHPSWQGCGEISKRYFSRLESNATRRGYEFDITIEYISELYEKQNHKCAYSGRTLHQFRSKMNNLCGNASLDRIDNTKGYVEGNVHWVCKEIQKMKTDFEEDTFLQLCKEVAEWRN